MNLQENDKAGILFYSVRKSKVLLLLML